MHVTSHDFDYDQMTDAQLNDPTFDPSTLPCVEVKEVYTINHTDKTAWMLLLNPAIVIVESAPLVNPKTFEQDGRAAPGILALLHQSVSGARMGPVQPEAYNGCTGEYGDSGRISEAHDGRGDASRQTPCQGWPWLRHCSLAPCGSSYGDCAFPTRSSAQERAWHS